jgi:hypothetical protein
MNDTAEVDWKPLPWDTKYLINKHGKVYSTKSQSLLRIQRNAYGYSYIGLKSKGSRKNFLIHRLLMQLFGPPMPDGKTHINHKDGNKTNNDLANLEWCNRSENMLHAIHVLKCPKPPSPLGNRGKLSKLSKPVKGIHIKTGEEVFFDSLRLADSAGFRLANVRTSIKGIGSHYKGYKWTLA